MNQKLSSLILQTSGDRARFTDLKLTKMIGTAGFLDCITKAHRNGLSDLLKK